MANERIHAINELKLGRVMAAHQPHLLPWLGYLHKVMAADVFVVVDHVQYERQNYQNRNRVLTRSGPQWIVAPVHQVSRAELIAEKRINNQKDGRTTWGQKAFRTLECAYGKAAFFDRYAPGLEEILTRPWTRLVDLDLALLRWHLEAFEIETPVVLSSSLRPEGAKSEMIVSMCKAVGAQSYLSGNGGSRRYLDLELFEREGLQVVWQQFEHPVYPQLGAPAGFVAGLAAIDLLFNCGPASPSLLRGGAQPLRGAVAEAGLRAERRAEGRASAGAV